MIVKYHSPIYFYIFFFIIMKDGENMAYERTVVRCDSVTTFSSVVGNITAFATEFFKGKFPPGFFKKIVISEELNDVVQDGKDIVKFQLPYAVINPELDLDNTYTETLPYWYTDTHYIPKHSLRKQGAYNVLRDEEHGIYIHCIPTRIKINFGVKMKVSTTMFMYNVLQYIRNTFVRETYEYLNDVHLQTEVPKSMIIMLSKYLDYNLDDTGDRRAFVEYLNKNSMQGIEENINLSTGNSMYAFNYIVNILSSYPDSPEGNKNIKGTIVDDCDIDFRFVFDLWIPNKFMLEIPNDNPQFQTIYEENYNDMEANKFKFNMVLDTHYILPKIENKHLLIKKSYVPDVNVEYDTLKFDMILTKEMRMVLDYLKRQQALTESIFQVIVMCGNKLLPRELYKVDYANYIVKTMFPMFNTTYTLLVYGDIEYLNEIANDKTIDLYTDSDTNENAYHE